MVDRNTNQNYFDIARVKSSPLLIDGAIGSYLQQKGYETDENLWTTKLNELKPEVILQLHNEYIESGADIITTNTFRTNPSSLLKAGISDSKKYVLQAVELAKLSANRKDILIAGSNAPAEDCYQIERSISNKELESNHRYHIDLLIENGVHFVLNETQSHFDEIKIICDHCDKNQIPYVLSLYVDENMNLLSGEKLESVFTFLKDHDLLAVGLNCISPIVFLKIIGSIHLMESWGFYLNCGSGNMTDKVINCAVQPEEYLDSVKSALPLKPAFIGSCCGSTPAHTKIIREFLDEKISS